MKRLERVILVQFSLFDFEEFELGMNSALLGANGAGKTTILDAIQVAMLGAHGNYISFNTQKAGGPRDRTLRDYCLGVTLEGGEQGVLARKRDDAQSFRNVANIPRSSAEQNTATCAPVQPRYFRDTYVTPPPPPRSLDPTARGDQP